MTKVKCAFFKPSLEIYYSVIQNMWDIYYSINTGGIRAQRSVHLEGEHLYFLREKGSIKREHTVIPAIE